MAELRVSELLDGRYKVSSTMGKGVFSNVCRAVDIQDNNHEVAIKIIRSNETMYKAGLKEAQILRTLNESDPRDKKHCIRLLRQFEHRGHLCLVFESLRCVCRVPGAAGPHPLTPTRLTQVGAGGVRRWPVRLKTRSPAA